MKRGREGGGGGSKERGREGLAKRGWCERENGRREGRREEEKGRR